MTRIKTGWAASAAAFTAVTAATGQTGWLIGTAVCTVIGVVRGWERKKP